MELGDFRYSEAAIAILKFVENNSRFKFCCY